MQLDKSVPRFITVLSEVVVEICDEAVQVTERSAVVALKLSHFLGQTFADVRAGKGLCLEALDLRVDHFHRFRQGLDASRSPTMLHWHSRARLRRPQKTDEGVQAWHATWRDRASATRHGIQRATPGGSSLRTPGCMERPSRVPRTRAAPTSRVVPSPTSRLACAAPASHLVSR